MQPPPPLRRCTSSGYPLLGHPERFLKRLEKSMAASGWKVRNAEPYESASARQPTVEGECSNSTDRAAVRQQFPSHGRKILVTHGQSFPSPLARGRRAMRCDKSDNLRKELLGSESGAVLERSGSGFGIRDSCLSSGKRARFGSLTLGACFPSDTKWKPQNSSRHIWPAIRQSQERQLPSHPNHPPRQAHLP
ncbi:acetyl-CoA synthetase [Anopheles sinensis]|uniref:Acetyl-CoA synthetase n=1 Tax=Anopheles sinensis TaxID=74873 RepID=A0A084VKF4_ANOSI|nr:acetyl-CoA synthetase [Anopheles sinensis]